METWHDRLITALNSRGCVLRDLVAVTGCKPPSVYAWAPDATKRTKTLGADNAAKICSYLSINLPWLLYGVGLSGLEKDNVSRESIHGKAQRLLPLSNSGEASIAAQSAPVENNQNIEIHQFDTGGAMGAGVLLRDQPGVIQSWRVTREWLEKNVKQHSGAKNLCIVTGFGDSMRPMFEPGDPLLVDMGVNEVSFDAIYFFRIGSEGFIKRLQRIPGEGIRAISENKAYESWTIRDGMDFEVFGRVLKAWRSEVY